MAVTVTEDLVLGHRYTEDKDGGTLVRVFKVMGLTRGTGTLLQARQAVNINYGRRHPNDLTLYVSNISAEPVNNSREQARVFVTYKTPDSQGDLNIPPEGVLRWHGGTRQVETERYADGTPIYVDYTPTGGTLQRQVGRVVQPERYGILSYTKEIATNPESFMYLLGSINNGRFRGGQKWSWMCTNFDAEYFLKRRVYRVSIDLEWSQMGHYSVVFFTNPATGLVKKSVIDAYNAAVGPNGPQTTGNGWVTKLHGPEANFAQFGLP